ncbi:MAG: C25 family cysteine peptidase [Ignavibacteria bacterium]|nr:C25 family cysteine peptidase [Ignavibacteria bacterium]
MKKYLRSLLLSLLILSVSSFAFANVITSNGNGTGISVNVIESRSGYTKLEYNFFGYDSKEIKINGNTYLSVYAPEMSWLMEKNNPELLTYKRSILIPDNSAMNYKILSQETDEFSTLPIMPSKGNFTRDIDPNSIPYAFSSIYTSDKYFPENSVSFASPYIVRDFRGMTIQFNPMQYNPVKGKMKITRRMVIEVFSDNSLKAENPLIRQTPLSRVSGEFAGIYRNLFMNYGVGETRFDSIPEPGKMLIICPTAYLTAIQPLVQWKQSRGLNVTVAEYPAATGSGNTAIKTYIQNMYNSSGSVTYIILVGDVADIPTLNGVYESAPSDPCYVKLAGTDAYPDAFISRISCQNASSVYYVAQKFIRFERDIEYGASWYTKGAGIGGPDVGGTPPYADSIRMNWVRDTLMAHGFTQVDKVNGPVATPQTLINVLNEGRYVLNYIGHGSGTSWSNTGFSTTNSYQLANGWREPFLVDVACLNGNFTLNECLAESLLRAGDTANPKGCVSIYASSTNASWVPPCDMQAAVMRNLANRTKKTAGAISFFGLMTAMDINGGSTGEGLKMMEQYNIFGDCSLLLSRGVPLGPSISHNQLPNTENLSGPYIVNATINTVNSGLVAGRTKLFWTRGTAFTDSVTMTNSSGNNWTATIPGNGSSANYRYFITTIDSVGRTAFAPGGAPSNYYSFAATPDNINPVITHTPLPNTPKSGWPATVTANATDNIGIDSVWVKWYINNTSTGIKEFKLVHTTGTTYTAAFNSTNAQVNFNDSIFYRIFARDISNAHNTDSTSLNKLVIINLVNACIGTGTSSSNYPFATYWHDGRTQMLFTASELNSVGAGSNSTITKIGFNVISASSQVMNGFNVRFQHTSATSLAGYVTSGWTTGFSGTYTVPGTGWQYIDMTSPYFLYNGTSNLLVEVCFDNTSWTDYSTVNSTSAPNMTWAYANDNLTGCSITGGATQSYRPNVCFTLTTVLGAVNNANLIPNKYELAQNYPNPFNPVTKINFALPKQGLVIMKIYDVLGREIRTLVNEIKQAGNYSVDFNASEFASGVYFYRLESNDFVDVKRMILIK